MSAESIYIELVRGGLSPVGACAIMGNMQAESALRANNAQDSCGRSDEEYTAAVDAGKQDFVGDAIGYGLCQWTYGPRKRKLLEYARSRGVSIADEAMQVEFCLKELREDHPALFSYLGSCLGVYDAAQKVCVEYERPAVNNVGVRAAYANGFYCSLSSTNVSNTMPCSGGSSLPAETSGGDRDKKIGWPPRELSKGMSGGDVAALQGLLAAHGYDDALGEFGTKTKAMVMAYQAEHGLKADGIAGPKTWSALLAR